MRNDKRLVRYPPHLTRPDSCVRCGYPDTYIGRVCLDCWKRAQREKQKPSA